MKKLREAHKEFIEHLKSKKRTSATILAYGKDIDQLIGFLEELQKAHVHEVTADDINGFLAKLQKNGYTPKSVSRKLNSTKTFFRFLKVQEFITDDPASLVNHPKFETKPPRILSSTEYRALRDASREDERISAIIELFLQTGVRIGELAQIRLEDVTSNELVVRNARDKIDRKVPVNLSSSESLKRYMGVRPQSESERLFITKTGRPLLVRNIRTAIDRYFKEAGIKECTVNDLRNTFIAHQLANNAPLEYVSAIVGHKRVSTTEKYLDLVDLGDAKSKDPKLQEL